jgi:hypothetical protein
MAMALVSILRWNSALGAYERLDREIDLDEYPGHREYADPDFGPGLSAFPYGIDDSVASLRSQVGRYANLWTGQLNTTGRLRTWTRLAQEALEAGDVEAAQEALVRANGNGRHHEIENPLWTFPGTPGPGDGGVARDPWHRRSVPHRVN